MQLSAPKKIVFLISVVLAVLAVASAYVDALQFGIPNQSMWTAVVAWLVLAAGNMMKGV